MAESVDSWPTARKRHRCGVCSRFIEPGEAYWRQAVFDAGDVWTNRTCEHCERVVWRYGREVCDEDEWLVDWVHEWLEDEHPNVRASMQAGWRFPDGYLMPVPFGSRCHDCGCRVEFRRLWCGPCDERRIARIGAQLAALSAAFEEQRSLS